MQYLCSPSVWTLCLSACLFKASAKKAHSALIRQFWQASTGTAHHVSASVLLVYLQT